MMVVVVVVVVVVVNTAAVKGKDSKKEIVNAISTGWTNTSWNYWRKFLTNRKVLYIQFLTLPEA